MNIDLIYLFIWNLGFTRRRYTEGLG